mmetsp:Transcript_109613/g.320813  ORF Transcript_109613/g.320813 Transcript_109613/m.320813 type:complete len:226 (+) Transcript_109613:545-1222(+)
MPRAAKRAAGERHRHPEPLPPFRGCGLPSGRAGAAPGLRLRGAHAHPVCQLAGGALGPRRGGAGQDRRREDSGLPPAVPDARRLAAAGRAGRWARRPGPGADPRARAPDTDGVLPLRGSAGCRRGRAVRGRGAERAAEGAQAGPGRLHRDAWPPHRLPRVRRREPQGRLLPCRRRGRPHAGHGFRTAATEHRLEDPAESANADVVCHLASGDPTSGTRDLPGGAG